MINDIFKLQDSEIELDYYTEAYPTLISYCQNRGDLTKDDFILLTHAVYGWMPTVLEVDVGKEKNYEPALKILNKAKKHEPLNESEFKTLKTCVNNSIVGASKLLHMIAPEKFPIWDSKIYKFIHGRKPHNYQVNNVKAYIDYMHRLENLLQHPEFFDFHKKINKKLDYTVSALRAVEIVMFQHIKKKSTP